MLKKKKYIHYPNRYIEIKQDFLFEIQRDCTRTVRSNLEQNCTERSALSPYLFPLVLDELVTNIGDEVSSGMLFAYRALFSYFFLFRRLEYFI